MIEEALNRLAAAIEAQTAVQTENQRLFAELVARGASPAPALHIVETEYKEPPKVERKTKVNKVTEPVSIKEEAPVVEETVAAEPEPAENGFTRPVNRDDVKELAMSLSRQDTSLVPHIKATIGKHGVKTISDLPETVLPVVFADLTALSHKLAREG